jgi:mRNA interferase RelE/StbE
LRFEFSRQAVKFIKRIDKSNKERIRKGIHEIPKGDIKPYKGSPGSYRLRIGDWRIIFSYQENNVVLIEKIDLRGQVYKGV